MQQPHLKLKEIIWEITGRCENHCKYCGSKEQWNEDIDEDRIKKIADEIVKYPPENINISGGDPLLVSYDTHKYITNLFGQNNIHSSILMNLKSLETNKEDRVRKASLYKRIGVSINTEYDIQKFKESNWTLGGKDNITVITNFNASNIFLFDKIRALVGKDYVWQIQYTVYHKTDEDDERAIYNNDAAIEFLKDSLQKAFDENVQLILADNMNDGPCGAGRSSIGILSNGDIVPCLSMRSWHKFVDEEFVGNILKTSLRDCWEEGFYDQRFKSFECCKDICKNKAITLVKSILKQEFPFYKTIPYDRVGPWEQIPGTMVYGVGQPSVTMYAVFTPSAYPYYKMDYSSKIATITNDDSDYEK